MSEKYSRIFSLGEALYSEGSPIVIEAGALLKDNETAWIIAQLKLKSIADLQIKTVKVEIKCLDSVGRPIGTIPFEYLDLAASRGQSFGAQTPIRISDSATRSFEARVVEVGFSDNSVWSGTQGVWKSLPKQNDISSRFSSEYAIEGYKSFFGSGAIYEALLANDLWLCSCGEINHSGEEKCHRCNAALADMLSVNEQDLVNEGIYAVAGKLIESGNTADLKKAVEEYSKISEYRDSAERIKICNDKLAAFGEKEEKAKKKKRVAITISSVVVALGLIGYFAIYPLISFFLGDYSVPINMYNIKEFRVPNGVTSIDDYAFSWCKSLTSIEIPDSVTSIGDYAFEDCTRLTSIEIPDSVTSIGGYAFYNCFSLTSVYITDIEAWCNISFCDYDSNPMQEYSEADLYLNGELVTELTIPDTVTKIKDYAFAGCTSITSVVIPDSVTSIGYFAFENCDSLTSVVIGDSVTRIGSYAFEDCTSLTSIKYRGSESQWNAISKGYDWNSGTGRYTITYNYNGD